MWKKPAAASLAAALALALASWAVPRAARAAGDEGVSVSFAGQSLPLALSLRKSFGKNRVLYQSGVSDAIGPRWDTVLMEGTEGDSNLVFEFSKRLPGGAWSPWVSAEIHLYQKGRFWGRAEFPAGEGALRLKIMDGGIKGHAALFISDIDVYDAAAQMAAATATPGAQNPPEPVMPPLIHARREWHAQPTRNPYTPMMAPWRITIHHTAGPQSMTLKDTLREVRFIQDFQQDGRGWDDIGYHFLIDGAGNIIEGRPVNAVGSHVKGDNDGNIGIAMMGYFSPPVNDRLTAAQESALVALLRYLHARYNIPMSEVKGHRDYERTECPGNNVYNLLPEIRREAALPAPAEKPLVVKRPPLVIKFPDSIRWDGRTAVSP
ncbi:MAG TPA: peptidoglycan recognition family protein [Elusimicrobiota bacterium]|nr:peptidoglycan recognition family protein [Elusimicrobiota bacterium]